MKRASAIQATLHLRLTNIKEHLSNRLSIINQMSAQPAALDVFSAISAPARRAILARLSAGEMPVQQLAESFSMTLPAVSQHLAVLREAGLVSVRKDGRQRIYQLNAKPLKDVATWVQEYEKFWTGKLAALGEHLKEKK